MKGFFNLNHKLCIEKLTLMTLSCHGKFMIKVEKLIPSYYHLDVP